LNTRLKGEVSSKPLSNATSVTFLGEPSSSFVA
jgi:hypothetical protein